MRSFIFALIWASGFFAAARPALAQEGIEYIDKGNWDFTLTAGTFLPFGIVGVRDSYPTWGVRLSHSSLVARFEYGLSNVHAKGVIFYNGSASARVDYRLVGMVDGFFLFGLDGNYYQRKATATRDFPYFLTGGGHFGFGGYLDITPQLAVRADFKMGFNPGRNLYAGVGLIYRFGSSEDTSGEAKD